MVVMMMMTDGILRTSVSPTSLMVAYPRITVVALLLKTLFDLELPSKALSGVVRHHGHGDQTNSRGQ